MKRFGSAAWSGNLRDGKGTVSTESHALDSYPYTFFSRLERDEIRLEPFSSRGPDAAQRESCEPGSTLLCMGLFSRFFVQGLPSTAEGTLCRVRNTRPSVPRAYGIQLQHIML